MSAGTSFHGRRKPNGSACRRRTMAGVQDEAKHAMSAMPPLKSCDLEAQRLPADWDQAGVRLRIAAREERDVAELDKDFGKV
jgi:hypothetical protein